MFENSTVASTARNRLITIADMLDGMRHYYVNEIGSNTYTEIPVADYEAIMTGNKNMDEYYEKLQIMTRQQQIRDVDI